MHAIASLVIATLLSSFASAQVDCSGQGEIQGRVVDGDGKPVADAVVTILSEQCVVTGIEPEVKTDADGNFALSRVPPGLNGVHAQKVEAGYPDTTGAIYLDDSAPLPKVVVRRGEVLSGVVVKLGRKAGSITGRIIDADNFEPVPTARIKISLPDNEGIMLSMGPDAAGRFKLLVPPRPVKLTITAPEYRNWQYVGPSQESPGIIRLDSEESKEVTVKLERLKK